MSRMSDVDKVMGSSTGKKRRRSSEEKTIEKDVDDREEEKNQSIEEVARRQKIRASSHNDEDDEYEEALVYLDLPELVGKQYLHNAKSITLENFSSKRSPVLKVDGIEFVGQHCINIGSNHFFCASMESKDELPEYKGHSIKTAIFAVSKINDPHCDGEE